MRPATLSWILAALITLPLADSLFQIPVQVSDSLEPIVTAVKYPTLRALVTESVRFSPTTLRPMRYMQARWLVDVADAAGMTYNAVFRGVHVVLLFALVALFTAVVRVRDWIDLGAFGIAFPVFIGIHTFVAVLQEAFPVNHYAEVACCVLAVLMLGQHRPRWFFAPLLCLLLAFTLSVVESGVMVWIAVIACALAGTRGITRGSVIATTGVLAIYLVARYVLDIVSPGIGGHGSGVGATFYSPEQLVERYGAHPLGFMTYNVIGGLASLLFSEPRQGVYSLVIWREGGPLHPVLIINLTSSIIATALLVWYAGAHLRVGRTAWSDRDRLFVAACVVAGANAALTVAYIKDEIISSGGVSYAVATFIASAALLATIPRRSLVSSALVGLLLVGGAALWTFRAAGAHYVLRYHAFTARNDWAEVLREDRREDWPEDPHILDITRRLRNEAIERRNASPSFMPRWADRYWVE